MLETAEEPEFLMADMSPEQLSSFSAYKAKLNVRLYSYINKKSICGKVFMISHLSSGNQTVKNGKLN